MDKSLLNRVQVTTMALATAALILLAVFNLLQERAFQQPTDGVWWHETRGGLVADRVLPESPGQFHTRIILERMAEHGVRVDRVINGGGVPQSNPVLNQVYANVFGKPVLVPAGVPTSLGSGIFALVAAGAYSTVEDAQAALCLDFATVTPDAKAAATYERLYPLYRAAYFALGTRSAPAAALGNILPELRKIAAEVMASA